MDQAGRQTDTDAPWLHHFEIKRSPSTPHAAQTARRTASYSNGQHSCITQISRIRSTQHSSERHVAAAHVFIAGRFIITLDATQPSKFSHVGAGNGKHRKLKK